MCPAENAASHNQPLYLVYQTDKDEVLPLPELAACLSLKAYLRINGLQYHTKPKYNAEHISPSKSVPFVKVGRVLISEYEPIITFMAAEGFQPSSYLTDVERAEMKAYMALVDSVLTNAERYFTYYRNSHDQELKYRPCPHHPWPLNIVLPWQRRRLELKRLAAADWLGKSAAQVGEEVESCCNALSEKLSGHFFNQSPTELDALVYGHIRAILIHDGGAGDLLRRVVGQNAKLTQFCHRFEETYFTAAASSRAS